MISCAANFFNNLRLEIRENRFKNLRAKPRNGFPQGFSNRFSMISCAAIYYIFLSPVTGGRYLIVYLYVAVVTDNLQCITHPSPPFYFRTLIPRIPRIYNYSLDQCYSCSFISLTRITRIPRIYIIRQISVIRVRLSDHEKLLVRVLFVFD